MIIVTRNETVGGALQWAAEQFKLKGFEFPDVEARYLMSALLDVTPMNVMLKTEQVMMITDRSKFEAMVERRLKHEPAAYILGTKDFMGLTLQVDSRVLIPRPETELLVEEAVNTLQARAVLRPNILDIGTGSGCIAVAMARALPTAQVLAVDISLGALKVAQVNARQAKVEERVNLLLSNGFEAIPPEKRGCFDMIVSNPPYIAASELARLEPDLFFEPRQALNGGPDGLSIIRRVITDSREFLKFGGTLMLEIGYDQGPAVTALLESAGYQAVSISKDYGGKARVAKGTFSGPV